MFKEHDYNVRFEQNDRLIKAAYPDGIFIWDIVGNHLVASLPLQNLDLNQNKNEHICATELSSDGRLLGILTSGDFDYWGRFILVDAESGKPFWTKDIFYATQGCGNIQFDSVSRNVFVSTWAPELFKFDVHSGDVIYSAPFRSHPAHAIRGFSQIVNGGCGLIASFGSGTESSDDKELNYWKLDCTVSKN